MTTLKKLEDRVTALESALKKFEPKPDLTPTVDSLTPVGSSGQVLVKRENGLFEYRTLDSHDHN